MTGLISSGTVKAARVLLGALAAGSPTFLEEAHVERIDTRPDEELRRRLLMDGPAPL